MPRLHAAPGTPIPFLASAWELHAHRTQMALNSFLEATKLKEKCTYWYEAMQLVAINQSWDKPLARELVDQAEAFEPSYYHFYREYANYLLPKWDGEEGDTQAYAEEISARLGGVRGDIVYFEIATLQACQCNPNTDSLAAFSWPRIKRGYASLKQLYGVSPVKMNRFAYMAYVANDRPAAQAAFDAIDSNWEPSVWRTQANFESARSWAATP